MPFNRPEIDKLYSGRKWRRLRLQHLRGCPCCVMCEKEGRLGVLGEVVDHIRPHKGSLKAFWDMTNWQTLCAFHHNNRKRDVERLGFSREIGLDGWPVDPAHPANRRP